MKQKRQKKRNLWNVFAVGGTATMFTAIFVLATFFIDRINNNVLTSVVYQMKQQMIHDTVKNQIEMIDLQRLSFENEYEESVQNMKLDLDQLYEDDASLFASRVQARFNTDATNHLYVYLFDEVLSASIYEKAWIDSHQGKPYEIYAFPEQTESIDLYFESIENNFHSFINLTYGKYRLFVGVPEAFIEKKVADSLRSVIYSMTYADKNTYMWVNKVLNPAGGDGYGIRVIHPNLRATEYVTPLSTNTLDYLGKTHPYLAELTGVFDDDGEVYFTYAFKLLESDKIGTKLAFSKYYEPYQWIVAMGIYVEDINPFLGAARSQSIATITVLVVLFLIVTFGLFVIYYYLMVQNQQRTIAFETQSLHEEISRDGLTGARSQKAAFADLEIAFKTYKKTGESVAMMLLDFDLFKPINDTYGHDAGNKVLIGVSNALKSSLRTTDHLYRLGGDEFVVLLFGLKKENAQRVAENLIRITQNFRITDPGQENIRASISIGVTYFNEKDQDYMDALKRADHALYTAKKTEKGTAVIELD